LEKNPENSALSELKGIYFLTKKLAAEAVSDLGVFI
jgi:hypothetical protein